MSGRLAIWLLAFLISLAVHSAILAGLLGITGTAGPPAAAELLIGDEAAFSALVVNPVAPETGLVEKNRRIEAACAGWKSRDRNQ